MKKGTYEDQIRIEELEVYAHHGVYPEENEKGQHFYVNATLYTNTRPAGLADDLSLSTNYGEVCQFITEFMQQHTFQLIETVAERTAYEVLQQFPFFISSNSHRRITIALFSFFNNASAFVLFTITKLIPLNKSYSV